MFALYRHGRITGGVFCFLIHKSSTKSPLHVSPFCIYIIDGIYFSMIYHSLASAFVGN